MWDGAQSVEDALAEQQARVLPGNRDGRPVPLEATILGDRSIPYRLLKKVMATCTAAGFGGFVRRDNRKLERRRVQGWSSGAVERRTPV